MAEEIKREPVYSTGVVMFTGLDFSKTTRQIKPALVHTKGFVRQLNCESTWSDAHALWQLRVWYLYEAEPEKEESDSE